MSSISASNVGVDIVVDIDFDLSGYRDTVRQYIHTATISEEGLQALREVRKQRA